MRRLILVLTLLLLPSLASGQATNIISSGTLPATCSVGNIYIKTGAAAGFYECHAANTWTGPLASTVSPSFTTPVLGAATGTSLDISGLSAFGDAASLWTEATLYVDETITDVTVTNQASYVQLRVDPSTAASAQQIGSTTGLQVPGSGATNALTTLLGSYTYVWHFNTNDVTQISAVFAQPYIFTSGTITSLYAFDSGIFIDAGSGDITSAFSFDADLDHAGSGTIGVWYGLNVDTPSITGGGTLTTAYGVYVHDITVAGGTANDYAFWYDGSPGTDCNGGGVARINHFGIFAYYNPCFAKYTVDAANFERLILRYGDTGVFGTDNLAYIGHEAGGTGTNRNLIMLGAGIGFNATPGVGTFLEGIEIATPAAPAANGGRIYFKDNGAGKTQACAIFSSGAEQCFATQP